jgi:RNA polymerase sigma-70 factor (sigma-E family)
VKPAEEAAFVEFAAGARERLRRIAYLLCGDWHLASDHTQEGLIRVYVAWPRLRRSGSEFGYARKAVVSAFLDARRKRSNRELPQEADPTLESGVDVAESVSARTALMAALAKLPPRQRACVVLRFFDDLSVADTAAVLGCSTGTVKSQTSKALDSLRAMFDDSPLGELTVTLTSTRSSSW